jgi:tetratricopeptide (TPR) repeat protein
VSWWIAGSSLAVVMAVLAWNGLDSSGAQTVGATATPPAPVLPSLSQASPRQSADQLFNRVMTASDNGDAATIEQFLPLALSAYEAARPLDMDGLFHVALLQRTGNDLEASFATAQEMLQIEPNHILGLNVAAQAAAAMGRDEEAAGYYREVLENLDTEMARPLFEYETHSRYFEVTRQEALAFLSERG